MTETPTPAQRRYREYLKTPHWLALRARIVARADEHCEWCGRFCGRNPHPGWNRNLRCGNEDCRWCLFYVDLEDGHRELEHQSLEVHHKTYERLGAERDEDLAAICWTCHDGVTERMIDLRRLYRAGDIPREDATPHAAQTRFGRVFYGAWLKRLRWPRGGK